MQGGQLHLRKSCGCEGGVKKHGLWLHPLYLTWQNMMTRCYNLKSPDYADYGGRGITICEEWKDPANFIRDMGEKPSLEHQIDRIDNNLGYCKENCRWTTPLENSRNRRTSRIVEYNGQMLHIEEVAILIGVKVKTLEQRIRLGKNPNIFRRGNDNS